MTARITFPLYRQQTEIVMSQAIHGHSERFQMVSAVSFPAGHDWQRVTDALTRLWHDKAILRVRFTRTDEGIRQYVDSLMPQWNTAPTVCDAHTIAGMLEAWQYEPAELFDAPLYDARLFYCGDRLVATFRIHHAIVDGLSLCRLKTMALDYSASRKRVDDAGALPEMRCDYLEQCGPQITPPAVTRYWQQTLPALLPFSKPALSSTSIIRRNFFIPCDQAQLARHAGVPENQLNTLYYSVMSWLWHVVSDETDFLAWLPVCDKPGLDPEALGNFVTLLPTLFSVPQPCSLQEWIARCQKVLFRLFRNRQISMSELNQIAGAPINSDVVFTILPATSRQDEEELTGLNDWAGGGLHGASVVFSLRTDARRDGLVLHVDMNAQWAAQHDVDALVKRAAQALSRLIAVPAQEPLPAIEPLHLRPAPLKRLNPTRQQQPMLNAMARNPAVLTYNWGESYSINAPLDAGRMALAVRDVTRHFTALRTVYQQQGRDITLWHDEMCEIPHKFIDLRNSDADVQAEIARLNKQPWSPLAPLAGSWLFQLAEQQFVWFFRCHHLIYDHHAARVMFTAVSRRYHAPDAVLPECHYPQLPAAFSASQALMPQPPAPLSFHGIAAAHCRSGHNLLVQEKISGDALRHFRQLTQTLSPARPHQAQANLLLAAFAATFADVCQQSTLDIGIFTHNRKAARWRETFGLMMEPRTLSLNIDTRASLQQLADDIALEIRSADAPTARGASLHFNYVPEETLQFGDLPVSVEWIYEAEDDDVPVSLMVNASDNDIELNFIGNGALFSAPQLQRIAQSCVYYLRQAGERLALEKVRRSLPALALQPEQDLPMAPHVLSLIRQHAVDDPWRIALETPTLTLTYGELWQAVYLCAQDLTTYGLKTGDRVALCLSTRHHAIIAMLACLSLGVCYIPLACEDLRSGRLDAALTRCGCRMIIGDTSEPAGKLLYRKHRLRLDCGGLPLWQPDLTALDEVDAYIIFTSGSTGEPKGVCVQSSALATFIASAIPLYTLDRNSRMLQFNMLTFDASVEEVYGTLCAGGTLLTSDDREVRRDFAVFLDLLTGWQPTHISLPTPFWSLLTPWMQERQARFPASLAFLITGGDEMRYETLQHWFALPRTPALFNTYGPTEATCIVSAGQVEAQKMEAYRKTGVPIGQLLPHCAFMVADENGLPVPAGCLGELIVAGRHVARGYCDRPFIAPGEGLLPPQRYATGDLVRWSPEEGLTFFGRKDGQVKISGYRVNPLEIDGALMTHPQVVYCTTLASEGALKQLHSVVVAPGCDVTTLRQHCQRHLPEWLVPQHIHLVDELPRHAANGKFDRRALLTLISQTTSDSEKPAAHPQAFSVFQKYIGQDLPYEANFLDYGATSLVIVQILYELRSDYGLTLELEDMYRRPSAKQLLEEQKPLKPAVASPLIKA